MPNNSFCPAFIEVEEIKEKVSEFRTRFSRCQNFPVDIEMLIEKDLGISIDSIEDLRSSVDTDAYITSDFRVMYVDKYEYMNERYSKRLRFSMAHEISHLVLHRELYSKLSFREPDEYIEFQTQKTDKAHSWLEFQANMFAGHLLMPPAALKPFVLAERSRLLESGGPAVMLRSQEYLADLIVTTMAQNLKSQNRP
jgi:histidinol phosphatase-like PHP family hydrolase